MADKDPKHLHPVVMAIMFDHIARAAYYGIRAGCVETYRDEAAQLIAWQQGRDALGNVIDASKVITNAPPGASYHGLVTPDGLPCSLAYHLGIYTVNGGIVGLGKVPLDSTGRAMYLALGRIGEGLGVRWGGNWDRDDVPFERGEWDLMHFERRVDGATLAQLRERLAAGQPILSA